MSANSSRLDANQVLKEAFDKTNEALRTIPGGGALIKENFDYIALTYVPSGNGAGNIQTVSYKSGGASGTLVATLTLAYDGSNNLVSVTKS